MKLVKYNKLPSILDEFFNDDWSFFNDCTTKGCCNTAADVIEHDDSFDVELMLPGFDKENIEMKVEDNSLKISAERKEREVKFNARESYYGTVTKSYKLPDYVDQDAIDASFENGVLTIKIPKIKEKEGTKSITIN